MDHDSEYSEQPVETVETRRFSVELEEAPASGQAEVSRPRLRLVANNLGQTLLKITIPPGDMDGVKKELFDRGYRGGMSCVGQNARSGSWRGYLNELEVAHIAVEQLGWTLSAEERGVLDAVDAYGRKAPTGFRSARLT
jgi:hypothetical protein